MFGSNLFRIVHGSWEPMGVYKTNYLVLPTSGLELPKGTWVGLHPDYSDELCLATGYGASAVVPQGFLTQGITSEGQTSLQSFKDRMIGKQDLPIKKGQAVTVRKLRPGAMFEAEGISDTPEPGNLVDNDAVQAMSVGDPISLYKGCIVPDGGKFSIGYLLKKDLTPYTAGKKRFLFDFQGISDRS
jgi:hypothetical protein